MRSRGLVLVLAGCGFHSNSASPPLIDDALPDTSSVPDAAIPPDAAVPPDAAIPPDAAAPRFCDRNDANLMACYEFENNANDGSSHGLNATTTGVAFVAGKVGLAMKFAIGSTAHVPGSPVFDVSRLTIEAWVLPSQIPATTQDVVDVDTQYALFINNDGTVTCDLRGKRTLSTTARLTGGQWTHLACTWDGSVARIYLGGSLSTSNPSNGMLDSGGKPMAIAANQPAGAELVGLIDQLRLMKVARSAAEICADAGQTSCL